MLSHVAIQNFKSIDEPGVDLELKPLTILVGPNGSGKSSILEAVYLFQDERAWKNSQFRREELFHKQDQKRTLVVEICLADGTGLETSVNQDTETIKVKADGAWYDPVSGGAFYHQKFGEIQSRLTGKTFFISALRGDMPREMSPTERVVTWTGPRGENLIYVLSQLNRPRYLDEKRKVEYWADEFGVKDLWSGLEGASLTVAYRDLGGWLPGILASFGARQILPIIANLFYCPPGSVFLIEEPEISLHPEAQVKLVEMFCEAVKKGKQLITTTHSHYLLLAVTEAIQREWIKSDDVCIWEITKEEEKGTVAKRLPMTEEGVIKGWVSSFAKVDAQLLKGRTRPASRVRR
jgi:predicted ATPase